MKSRSLAIIIFIIIVLAIGDLLMLFVVDYLSVEKPNPVSYDLVSISNQEQGITYTISDRNGNSSFVEERYKQYQIRKTAEDHYEEIRHETSNEKVKIISQRYSN